MPDVPPADPAPVEPARPPLIRRIQIHGFISEGAFWSTDNDYIGESERGSLELFEAGINFSTEVSDRLTAGIQLFARDFGEFEDAPRLDWAFLDYKWRSWLGLRAGIIKMPFGLYNEYADIDATRTSILLPQSVYSIRNRDVLLSHRGFALYGREALGAVGELEYQVWLGTLSVPENALTVEGATLDRVDTRYVTGAQVFWMPPVEGLRIGATYLRASIGFDLTLSAENRALLIAAGILPADSDGKIVISQRPIQLAVGSAEYTRGSWTFAAEYARLFTHQTTSLPAAFPASDVDTEAFYGLASYRVNGWLELGGNYSALHDANDRRGKSARYPERFYAWQRDAALSARFDVTDRWLWKLEAHFIDGISALTASDNPNPERYWGMFLARTTVTF